MFVFVYSSYHLQLSLLHLVVILTTLEALKNIFRFNNNIMKNDNSKQENKFWNRKFQTPKNPSIIRVT